MYRILIVEDDMGIEKTDRDVGFGSELCGEFQKCAGRVFRICPPTGAVGYFTTFL